ncbi:MAG: Gfo/Idh/MocA family oxidoreductase [Chloroflexota bacterium]
MDRKLRVGIVGTGGMGQRHAQAWSRTPAIICGFVSRSPDASLALAHQFDTKVYGSLEELLPFVDVIDVCVPTHLHHEVTLAGAQAGVHVICEKPLARTIAEAEEMIAVCDSAGVKLLVAHVVRYFPEYAAAQQSVEAGEIGHPAIIRLNRGTNPPSKPDENWFLDEEKSGGVILDLMVHDFDYARWIGGEIKTVFAKNVRTENPSAEFDHALVILTHENGTISHIEGSWALPAPMFRTAFEISGSIGLIEHHSDQTASIKAYTHSRHQTGAAVPMLQNPLHFNPCTAEIQSFYDHLVYDTPIPVTAEDGLAALKIALAAVQSAKTGLPVQISNLEAIA